MHSQHISIEEKWREGANRRNLLDQIDCAYSGGANRSAIDMDALKPYFDGMTNIYKGITTYDRYGKSVQGEDNTCLPVHKKCGWGLAPNNTLPTLIMAVGLEGSGHHLVGLDILGGASPSPIRKNCELLSGPHYATDSKLTKGDKTRVHSSEQYMLNWKKFLRQRKFNGCKILFDYQDSFPFQMVRSPMRAFNHPDMSNLEYLNGKIFNIKYVVLVRNVTDCFISALRRGFPDAVVSGRQTISLLLSYLESSLASIPCSRIFYLNFEHALGDPLSYLDPLSAFLELNEKEKNSMKVNLQEILKPHKSKKTTTNVKYYEECKNMNATECLDIIKKVSKEYFDYRSYMWPTFAGMGNKYKSN